MSLGDWSAILYEVADSKRFRRLPAGHPFEELPGFLGPDSSRERHGRLLATRNDQAHLRTLPPSQQISLVESSWEDLEHLYSAAEFTADHPLVLVLATGWDELEGVNRLAVRQLSGDHSVVPATELVVSASTIERSSLYLQDHGGGLHLARPLLVGRTCKHCGHWSTFGPDRHLGTGEIEYRSLEHGHSMVIDEVQALRAIGLIGED